MGTDASRNPTELEDFLAVLTQTDDEGQSFVMVGGQAVNYWAKLYLPREPRSRTHLPFTRKDLDLIRSKTSARQVAQTLGWRYSPPVMGGGPVRGVVSSPATTHPLRVEFLWEIKGVPQQSLGEFARRNVIEMEGSGRQVADSQFLTTA